MYAAKAKGFGSSVKGELLLLAIATCYRNDVYREASKRGVAVSGGEVNVSGEFRACFVTSTRSPKYTAHCGFAIPVELTGSEVVRER
jgi:uncharacterized OsmC-like protein